MSYTKIAGTAVATADQMIAYIKQKNASVAQSVLDMIPLYLSEGKTEGIRGDIAFAQSCLETGNFMFKKSDTAVTLSQNNFCGMGVTSYGKNGNSFSTPQMGIRAQIQHLKAYATKSPLVNSCIDPRFQYVTRGCAEYVEWLGMKENPKGNGWAAGANYGGKILTILKNIIAIKTSTTVAIDYNEELYRVRKSWGDNESQLGAYRVLENAKQTVDENAGYHVYDSKGNLVYPLVYDGMYRVRTSWSDVKSQKGAYTVLDNAKECCDQNAGTMVYTDDGVPVYPLPFIVNLTKESDYFKDERCTQKGGTAQMGQYTITAVDSLCTCGKLKSGAGWLPLAGLPVNLSTSAKNYLSASANAAKQVYTEIYDLGCVHAGGSTSLADIRKKKKVTCNSSVSVVLQEAGILPVGKTIGHTSADGKNGNTKKTASKNQRFKKAANGLENLKDGTYELAWVDCLYKNLPAKYKQAGMVYIQDSNACVSAGDGKIYSCNQTGKKYGKNGEAVLKTSGYPFGHEILFVIAPKEA